MATYIEIPFMVMPIYNSLKEIDPALISASSDLGASFWQTFRYVIWPLSWPGVESGIQAIFIPGVHTATCYYEVKAQEIADGKWSVLYSEDLATINKEAMAEEYAKDGDATSGESE